MCNRNTLSVPAASLFPRYNASAPDNPVAAPAAELFPRKPAYVVREAAGIRILDVMAWGFPMAPADTWPDVPNKGNILIFS